MEQYKPIFLGKTMPSPDNPPDLQSFLSNKYEAFNTVYDACKSESEKIDNIETVSSSDDKLTVKVSTDKDTFERIQTNNENNPNLSFNSNAGYIEATIK